MAFVPLNWPVTIKTLSNLKVTPTPVSHGPDLVEFRQLINLESSVEGIPMPFLIHPTGCGPSFVDKAHDTAMKEFADAGVELIHIVVWGPLRPNGHWSHHVRSMPAEEARNKGSFALAIALIYKTFTEACERQPKAPANTTQYKPLDFSTLSLVAATRIEGNVYEITIKGPAVVPPVPIQKRTRF